MELARENEWSVTEKDLNMENVILLYNFYMLI